MIFKHGYYNTLTGADRSRYDELVKLCGNVDPYEVDLKTTSDNEDLIPSVNIMHILQYLVHSTKSCTMKQMMAYKATEGHQFLTNGWVQLVRFLPIDNEKILCFCKVKHSQRFSDSCLNSWCLVKKSGDILAAWCTCVAGRCEACSHVGALLYSLEYGCSTRERKTCTSRTNSWLPPSLKEVPFSEVRHIDYTPSDVKRRRMMGDEEDIDDPRPAIPEKTRAPIPEDEVKNFLGKIHDVFPSAALLRVVADFADEYAVPHVDLPFPLGDLFDTKHCSLSLPELQFKAKEVFHKVKISLEQARHIERRTRKQSLTKLWNYLRAGLITASNMLEALRTNLNDPSITLIKKCCYPFDNKFMSYWMKRGLLLEGKVRKLYLTRQRNNHQDLRIILCGFIRSLEASWIGASPDFVVYCSCCGWGLGEIKCPKNVNPSPAYVCPKHMYQMQTQLFCIGSKHKYVDYIVFHPTATTIERVYPDIELQEKNC